MARKKKSLKDSQESVEDPMPGDMHTTVSNARVIKDEDDNAMLHTSDSEIFDAKKKTQLQKNKSNLFLIKSYSFIDKSNVRRPKVVNIPQKLHDFENYHSMLKDEISATELNCTDKQRKAMEKFEKSSKKSKHNKLKKSKSTYDSTEDLQEFRDILRKPSVILEDEVSASSKRPLTFQSEKPHRPVVKSKTMEDIDTSPHIKRESFIRHSLQSIRRSFSSSKKYNISTSSSSAVASASSASSSSAASSSASSSSSSCSDTSGSMKKPKTKKNNSNNQKLKDKEHMEDVYKISPRVALQNGEIPAYNCPQQSDFMDTTSPDIKHATTPHPPLDFASSASSSSCCSSTSTSSSSSAASAGLSVLQEEDEKDLQNPPERFVPTIV